MSYCPKLLSRVCASRNSESSINSCFQKQQQKLDICLPVVRHVDGSEDLDLGEARDIWCTAVGTTRRLGEAGRKPFA